MDTEDFGFGTQIRKSPYFDATVRWGAKGFSVYNHMYIPRDFGDPEQNFWNLVNDAILCDVAVERQVEITGPDAAKFVQMLTPRDLSKMAVGQCKYILITNAEGGILNDPILLRLAENHFWISLADSDILLWAQGVAVHSGLDVRIGDVHATQPSLGYDEVYYKLGRYTLGKDELIVESGVFIRRRARIPFSRIQDVTRTQGPIERMYGVSTLLVQTAGFSGQMGPEGKLRGITDPDAMAETIMAAVKKTR